MRRVVTVGVIGLPVTEAPVPLRPHPVAQHSGDLAHIDVSHHPIPARPTHWRKTRSASPDTRRTIGDVNTAVAAIHLHEPASVTALACGAQRLVAVHTDAPGGREHRCATCRNLGYRCHSERASRRGDPRWTLEACPDCERQPVALTADCPASYCLSGHLVEQGPNGEAVSVGPCPACHGAGRVTIGEAHAGPPVHVIATAGSLNTNPAVTVSVTSGLGGTVVHLWLWQPRHDNEPVDVSDQLKFLPHHSELEAGNWHVIAVSDVAERTAAS